MSHRRVLALLALVAGAAAVVAGGAAPLGRVRQVAALAARGEGRIAAVDLARRIRARETGLRVIDLRPAEAFASMSVPGATRSSIDSLIGSPSRPGETLVVYGDGPFPAQAWILLVLAGHQALYLGGGLEAWEAAIINPVLPAQPTDAESARWIEVAELSRYFGGFPITGGPRLGTPPAWMDRSGPAPAPVAWPRRRGC
ncbi:MAG: rhodanese-like domain-containing protein [Gemmatimonadales bacterium]